MPDAVKVGGGEEGIRCNLGQMDGGENQVMVEGVLIYVETQILANNFPWPLVLGFIFSVIEMFTSSSEMQSLLGLFGPISSALFHLSRSTVPSENAVLVGRGSTRISISQCNFKVVCQQKWPTH